MRYKEEISWYPIRRPIDKFDRASKLSDLCLELSDRSE